MTLPQPHRYRCETCAYWDKDKHPHTICKLTNDALEGEDIAFIERHGCCSHSQHQNAEQSITGFHNNETNETFKDAGSMVLDAQKRYKELMNLTYCDIECVVKCPDENTWYILDECGNWNYFPSDKYEIIFAETKGQMDAEQRIADVIKELEERLEGSEEAPEYTQAVCEGYREAIALLREGK